MNDRKIRLDRMDHLEIGASLGKPRERIETKEAIKIIDKYEIELPIGSAKKIIDLLKIVEKYEDMPNPFIAGFNITVEKERRDLIMLIAEGNWYKTIIETIKYELDTPKSILINGEDIRNRIKQLEQRYIQKEKK